MRINIEDYRKVFTCGDVHGEISLLLKALKEVGYNSDTDLIISVGDLIDRGEDSLSSVQHFLNPPKTLNGYPSALAVMGNHESFGIDVFVNNNKDWAESWYHYGGSWVKDYSEDDMINLFTQIKEKFPLFIDLFIGDKHVAISHASIPGYNYDLIESHPNKELIKHCLLSNGPRFPIDEEDEIETLPVKGIDLAIHGHTITEHPYLYKNRLYIDTGCFKDSGILEGSKNYLTILELNKETGAHLYGFKRNEFLQGIEWVENKKEVEDTEIRLSNILFLK